MGRLYELPTDNGTIRYYEIDTDNGTVTRIVSSVSFRLDITPSYL